MYEAEASPEKRLFISLITRDISLIDAVIDLTDNSVNAAMKNSGNPFSTTEDFERFIGRRNPRPIANIDVKISDRKISIIDTAGGISFKAAEHDVFTFGHREMLAATKDRLSVYGIGMKRAVFKIGNTVKISSDHPEGGFLLDLNVRAWETDDQALPWHFNISKRAALAKEDCGTSIEVTELYDDVKRRISDGHFIDSLKDKLSRVYSYFLGRLITISVNGKNVEPTSFDIGENNTHDTFEFGEVSFSITAGIAHKAGDHFKDEAAGWYVFCNGRNVIYADKGRLTGWSVSLPIFQPKHRPFIGMVFFVSADPEELPWTTTKGSINEDSLLWQETKRHMATIGRSVTNFLDRIYTDTGTGIERAEIAKLSGKATDAFAASIAAKKTFKSPDTKKAAEVKIQYNAREADINKVRKHLAKPKLSGSEVGRYTFNHFLKNEVGS